MTTLKLEAERRTIVRKGLGSQRREGILPGILYGAGVEPTPLQVDVREATKILSRAGGSTLLELKLGKDTHNVLVREVQRDVITRDLLHLDFLKVAMDVVIRAEVPIELVGEAPAAKELGGILLSGVSMVEVEALPADLPDRIQVDLSNLAEIDDAVTVGDLQLASSVSLLTDPSELIARVIFQAEEEIVEEVVEELELLEGEEPELVGEDEEGAEEQSEEASEE
jgi:large subunit ribosomal protein L25